MARRNLLRSLLAASVMVVSGTTGLLVATPTPAGAIENPDHRVTVYETRFDPPIVYAGRGETVQFDLAPGVSTNHTVTLDNGTCGGRPAQLCERNFDDPDDPPVFRFFDYGEYRYHDRIAREAGQHDMGGAIIVTDTPPPTTITTTTTTTTPPPTTATTQPTTTTTRPVTTTTLPPSSTTTTAPTTIRPFVIPDSPTTTTAAPIAAVTPPANGGDAARPAGKDPSKGKGKGKAASAGTATTNTSPLPDGPIDVVFDAESLTPLPDPSPTDVAPTPDSGSEEAALLDLLSGEKPAGDKADVLLAGVIVLAVLGLAGGGIAWYHRSSRYIPA